MNAKAIDVMASDSHVAGVANDTAKAGGKTLDVRSTVIFSMNDGKVTEAWHYIDDLVGLRFISGVTVRAQHYEPVGAGGLAFLSGLRIGE